MAFNAGSIEATLTLDRNPFTAGLKAARAEANRWARNDIKVAITPQLSQVGLAKIREQLSKVVGRAMINPRLDQDRMRAVKAQIERQVGRITVRPRLDQDAMRALRERVNNSVGRIQVRARLDQESLMALRERLRNSTGYISVRLRLDRDSLTELRARLRAMVFRATLQLDTDTDILALMSRRLADIESSLNRGSSAANNFGNQSSAAFGRAHGAMRVFIALMPALLPMLGALVQGAIGLGGALLSAFVTAGAAVAAFAVVAKPIWDQISEGAKKTRAEIAKLPPGIREGADALKTLQEEYGKLVERTRENVGLAMAAGFNAATAAIKTLDPVINATSQALVRIGQDIERYFGTAHWREFVDFLSANVGPTFDSLWRIVSQLTRAVMELTIAFNPLAQWLLAAIADGMERFANWASTLANDPAFIQWMEQAKESLRSFWEFLVSVTQFLFNLANALAPIGVIVMDALTGIFNALSQMPPEWLAGIALGLSAVMAALLFGASGPVAAVVGVITGVAAALLLLYDSSERVRSAIDPVIATLRDIFVPVFERLAELFEANVIPAFERVGDTILNTLLPAFNDFLTAAGPFISFFTEQVGVVAVDAMEKLLEVVDYVLQDISSALRFWAAVFRGDWDAAWEEIQVSFGLKMGLMETLFGDMWRDFTTTMQEEGQILADEWNTMWENIKTTLSEEGDILKSEWETMLGDIRTTLEEEAEIWKGIWNDIWDFFGGGGGTQEGNAGGSGMSGFVEQLQQMWMDIQTTMQEEEAILDQDWANMWQSIRDTLIEEAGLIKTEIDGIWPAIRETAVQEWELLKTEWMTLWESIGTTLTEEAEILKTEWTTMWTDLGTTLTEEKEIWIQGWTDFWTQFTAATTLGKETLITEWNSIWPAIKETALQEWELIKLDWTGMWESVKTTLLEEGELIKVEWQNLWTTLYNAGVVIWDQLKLFWTDLWAQFGITQETGQATSTASFTTWTTGLLTNFTGFAAQLVAQATAAWNSVVAGIVAFVAQGIAQFNNFRTQALAAVTNLVTQVVAGFNNLRAQAVAAIANLVSQAVAAFNNMRTQAVSAITQMVSQAVAAFRSLASQALSVLQSLPGQMASIGRSIVQGIISGVQSAAGGLFSALRSLASRALAAAKSALGVASPSRLFRDEVGVQIGAGLIAGIRSMIPQVASSMRNLMDDISPDGKITVMPKGQFSVSGLDTSPITFDKQERENRIASLLEEIRELLERNGTGKTVNMHGVGGNDEDDVQASRLALRFT